MVEVSQLVGDLVIRHDKILIGILEDIHAYYNYLPEETLREVSKQLNMPLIDVYGAATFYKSFSLKPRGEHLISVCLGTACHVRNAPIIAAEFEKQLGIKPGETTPDKKFSLEKVNCLGACALGPIVVVDGIYFSHVNIAKVKQMLDKVSKGLDKVDVSEDERIFPVEVKCPNCNHSFMDPEHLIDNYPSIRVTISFGRNHGWHRLSSLYGSYNFESEHERPLGIVANYFCPHCHTELIGVASCPECSTTMVPMIVRHGGIVQVCPRRGCKGHILDV